MSSKNKKLMNPNDIFSQIGLAIDPNNKILKQKDKQGIAYLQIQLGDNQIYFLQIKQNDNPQLLAKQFCALHRLNKLAVQIVQNKIIQAKQSQIHNSPFGLKYRKQVVQNQNDIFKPPKQTQEKTKNQGTHPRQRFFNIQQTSNLNYIKNKNNNLIKQAHMVNSNPHKKSTKNILKQNSGKNINNNTSQKKLSTREISENMYYRGIMATKALKEKNMKAKLQKQQQIKSKQSVQLTFKPQMNIVSQKINQFRKENPKKRIKNDSPTKQIYKELEECTFKPKINKVSQIIHQSKQSRKKQQNHFQTLYHNKRNHINLHKTQKFNQENTFHPKINLKHCQRIEQPFMVRMQKAIQKKNLQFQMYQDKQCSFHPKICRAPKNIRNKQNQPIWQYLYNMNENQKNTQENKFSCHSKKSQKSLNTQITSANSDHYYNRLIQNKIIETFQILDSDNDGFISPNQIAIQTLTKTSLLFLKPILIQIDELGARIDYSEFKKGVQKLIQESDIELRGKFLAERIHRLKRSESTFMPVINQKSRLIARQIKKSRDASVQMSNNNYNIYNDLYEKGLRQRQQKQIRIQIQKSVKQEKEMQQCSFKPMLNNSSRYYINKILNNKRSEKIGKIENKEQQEINFK